MKGYAAAQNLSLAIGAIFLLVGVLGFIPGIVTNYDGLAFAGDDSGAKLLGLFQVSVLHNLVHALFGIAGFVLARTLGGARLFLVGGGVVYLALFIYGLLVEQDSSANFVPVNTADNILHLGLGIGMVVLGLAASALATTPLDRRHSRA